MYPKEHNKKANSGRTMKNNLEKLKSKRLFIPFNKTPNVIWITPKIILNFILKEFTKEFSVFMCFQPQSIPNG
jgi:hypothetical protein